MDNRSFCYGAYSTDNSQQFLSASKLNVRHFQDIISSKKGVQVSLSTRYLPSTILIKSNFSRKFTMVRVESFGSLKTFCTSSTDILPCDATRVIVSSIGCILCITCRHRDQSNYPLCRSSSLISPEIIHSSKIAPGWCVRRVR